MGRERGGGVKESRHSSTQMDWGMLDKMARVWQERGDWKKKWQRSAGTWTWMTLRLQTCIPWSYTLGIFPANLVLNIQVSLPWHSLQEGSGKHGLLVPPWSFWLRSRDWVRTSRNGICLKQLFLCITYFERVWQRDGVRRKTTHIHTRTHAQIDIPSASLLPKWLQQLVIEQVEARGLELSSVWMAEAQAVGSVSARFPGTLVRSWIKAE